uniref:C2H2-type domain-containing protein n=1 Tax=Strigamia maritima TaxID=126957 RepID=T1IW41_STRMM
MATSNYFNTLGWKHCMFCQGSRFLDSGIKSEFQRTDRATSGNLTDFTTRCTWVLQSPIISCPRVKTKNDRSGLRLSVTGKPFLCDQVGCGKSFARNEELTRHKRIHSGERPHQCEICLMRFGRKDHLTKHRKTHIKASERRNYICDIGTCNKSFTRSDALTRHQSKIHKIKKIHSRISILPI